MIALLVVAWFGVKVLGGILLRSPKSCTKRTSFRKPSGTFTRSVEAKTILSTCFVLIADPDVSAEFATPYVTA